MSIQKLAEAIARAPETSRRPRGNSNTVEYWPAVYNARGSQDPETSLGSGVGWSALSKIDAFGSTIDNVPRLQNAWAASGTVANPSVGTKLCVLRCGTTLLILGIEIGATH